MRYEPNAEISATAAQMSQFHEKPAGSGVPTMRVPAAGFTTLAGAAAGATGAVSAVAGSSTITSPATRSE